MKNSKICPKCGFDDIVRINGHAGPYGSGNHIMLGMTNLSAVNVNRYICCYCGFTEEWIDQVDLDRIKNSKKAQK